MGCKAVKNKHNPSHSFPSVLALLLLCNSVHECLVLLHHSFNTVKEGEEAVLGVKEHLALPLVLALLPTSLPLNQAQHLQLVVFVCTISPSKAVSDAFDRTEPQPGSQEIVAGSSHTGRHQTTWCGEGRACCWWCRNHTSSLLHCTASLSHGLRIPLHYSRPQDR